jgi:DNA-directed RNA polymerase subunit M/transcription elongation factor TFIIS
MGFKDDMRKIKGDWKADMAKAERKGQAEYDEFVARKEAPAAEPSPTEAQSFTVTKTSFAVNPIVNVSWRILCGIMTFFGYAMGVVACVTIIGIPVGLLMFSGAKTFGRMAAGARQVTCPNCSHRKNYVQPDQQTFNCGKCHERVAIEWKASAS